jgi:hypothetical protein
VRVRELADFLKQKVKVETDIYRESKYERRQEERERERQR